MAPPELQKVSRRCGLLGHAGRQADRLEASIHPLPAMGCKGIEKFSCCTKWGWARRTAVTMKRGMRKA